MKEKKLNELQLKNEKINKSVNAGAKAKLTSAKMNKNDEFYTLISDIEKELKHYRKHFLDKTVFLNCDDPEWSNFFKYFYDQFNFLGLKKVISTHYEKGSSSYVIEITKGENLPIINKSNLRGDGDFRSQECLELLKESDIVVTNPPFSLFREFIALLIEYQKKFIVIGNNNAVSYSDIFKLVKSNALWLGKEGYGHTFLSPKDNIKIDENDPNTYEEKKMGNTIWFTNVGKPSDKESFPLWEKFEGNEHRYPKYFNYDAINVNKSKDIPYDYEGVMGVPITFLHKLNTEQFEIIGIGLKFGCEFTRTNVRMEEYKNNVSRGKFMIDCKAQLCLPATKEDIETKTTYKELETGQHFVATFARLLIRNKKPGIEG